VLGIWVQMNRVLEKNVAEKVETVASLSPVTFRRIIYRFKILNINPAPSHVVTFYAVELMTLPFLRLYSVAFVNNYEFFLYLCINFNMSLFMLTF